MLIVSNAEIKLNAITLYTRFVSGENSLSMAKSVHNLPTVFKILEHPVKLTHQKAGLSKEPTQALTDFQFHLRVGFYGRAT